MNELITIKNDVATLSPETANELVKLETAIKQLEKKQKDLKAKVLQAMEEHNIIKIDTEELSISYIARSDREDFNKANFKKDNPDLYDEYVNIISIKPSIRVKVK